MPLVLGGEGLRRLGRGRGATRGLHPPVKNAPVQVNQERKSRLATFLQAMTTKPSYPPGGTWFDTLKKSFTNVTVDATNDNAIPTADFLEAAESLTTLFGSPQACSLRAYGANNFSRRLGFSSIQARQERHFRQRQGSYHPPNKPALLMLMRNQKVRDRQLAAPMQSETLQSLVVNELQTKKHTAAEGLLWLVRSVGHFLA